MILDIGLCQFFPRERVYKLISSSVECRNAARRACDRVRSAGAPAWACEVRGTLKTWQTVLLIIAMSAGISIALFDRFSGAWKLHQLVGISIMIPSFCLWALAHLQLGMSFSGEARATALVTHGLYSKIRNPIYVFGGVFIVGLFVFFGNPYLWLLLLVIVPIQISRLRREDQVLEAAFGDAYRAYKKRTWF
jgi:protein-S-isoprenylcysteine O-methyltransferase Ste14